MNPAAMEAIGFKQAVDTHEGDVRRRLVYSMLNEAVRALHEGVVRSARDGDLGAIYGMGFPPYRGGPLRYLDALGVENAVAGLAELADRYGDRFGPAPGLEQMAEGHKAFYANT